LGMKPSFIVYQRETSKTGTEHLQGYFEFAIRKKFVTLHAMHRSLHLEVRRGTQYEASAYCEKEETRTGEQFTWGEKSNVVQGQRTDLEVLKEALDSGCSVDDIASIDFSAFCRYNRAFDRYKACVAAPSRNSDVPVSVLVFWGVSGSGKTRKVQELAGEDVYWVAKPEGGNVVWWDGYTGQRSVIIDDFYGWMPWAYILRLLDRYPMKVQIKGGMVNMSATTFYITSNTAPESWYSKTPKGRPCPLMRRIQDVTFMDLSGPSIIRGDGNIGVAMGEGDTICCALTTK
jgi:hypothetical protein